MDMIDRYLNAVRGNLPTRRSSDIAAELDAELRDRIEAREAELGRPLARDETAALLRGFGHPLMVAWRYRDRQSLLGAETYPFFHFTMRIILMVAAILLLIGVIGAVLLDGPNALGTALRFAAQGLQSLLAAIGVAVIAFLLLEQFGFPASHLRAWRPESLPAAPVRRLSAAGALVQLAFILAFMLWWAGLAVPPIPANAPIQIMPAVDVSVYFWPVIGLGLMQIALVLLQWLAPGTIWRGLLLGLFTGTALYLLASYSAAGAADGEWLRVATIPGQGDEAALQASLNLAVRIGIVAIAVVLIVDPVVELYRLWRSKRAA